MSTSSVSGALVGLIVCAHVAGAQQRREPEFHSGLTATVVQTTGAAGLSCGEVTLRWAPHPAARSYRSYVSESKGGVWTALPSKSACGSGRATGTTGFIDPQPAPSTTSRRLFYRVIAIGPAGPIDSTDVVPVELAPSRGNGRP